MGKKALFLAAIAVTCTVFIGVGYRNDTNGESSIVATIDSEPITVQKLMPKLIKHRSDVFDYFKKEHHAEPGEGFWTSSFDGEIPVEMLKRLALDESIRIKVQQMLGKEMGLVTDIGYSQFLEDLKKENERRKTAIEQKKVIYGPKQYTEEVYYSILITDLTQKLKEKVAEQLIVSDDEIKQYYDQAIKENKYKKTGTVMIEKISIPFTARDEESQKAAKEMAEEVRTKFAEGARYHDLSKWYGEDSTMNIEFGEQIFDSTTYREDYLPSTHAFTEMATGLLVGQVSKVFEHDKAYYVIRCIEKTDEGFNRLEEVNEKIKALLKEKKYASYVDDLVKNATVVINEKVFDKLEKSEPSFG